MLPPALLVTLLFDAANNALVVISDLLRFVRVAAILGYERIVREEVITQEDRGILP
jgi:hypothetical protein